MHRYGISCIEITNRGIKHALYIIAVRKAHRSVHGLIHALKAARNAILVYLSSGICIAYFKYRYQNQNPVFYKNQYRKILNRILAVPLATPKCIFI